MSVILSSSLKKNKPIHVPLKQTQIDSIHSNDYEQCKDQELHMEVVTYKLLNKE